MLLRRVESGHFILSVPAVGSIIRIRRILLSNFYMTLWHIPTKGMVIPVRATGSAKGKLVKATVEHEKKVKKVKTARSANAIPMSKDTSSCQVKRFHMFSSI